jgi:hypothetical protein
MTGHRAHGVDRTSGDPASSRASGHAGEAYGVAEKQGHGRTIHNAASEAQASVVAFTYAQDKRRAEASNKSSSPAPEYVVSKPNHMRLLVY